MKTELLDAKETAELLGVTDRRVRALIKQKKLAAQKIGNSWAINKLDALKLQPKATRKAGRPVKPPAKPARKP